MDCPPIHRRRILACIVLTVPSSRSCGVTAPKSSSNFRITDASVDRRDGGLLHGMESLSLLDRRIGVGTRK
ncbi:hypothetical protein PF005_g29099 [Phytophthora fragariae]|uniref:Uncharacterized protein n=1 Tax=Phytophthora fragariae TaxID=53985 RepID=A0A6A3Q735_9STRA|nr:hypothetical protein PF003_g28605 [Phytophthora fragariae]KAE8919642.1 hypothetical protein PF009_g30055 [Phytophthora fragariae]KAE8964952.1 hypothetical protein PF011_g28482 [Phytophthora fragariae]KAE9062704.1 hypothetical protein PF010_g29292 [Phytophthora fragariae]KAE9065132.1 hypothetical protein PF007_g28953 [Phytophthora fragariae]